MRLDELVGTGEAMHEELGREYYLTGSGQKGEPSFQAIYDRFAKLQNDEALAVARMSGSRELLEWIIDVRIGRLVAPLEEQQIRWEQQAVLSVDRKRVPYLRAPIELANSTDRSYRIALDAARSREAAQSLNDMRRERFSIEHEAMRGFGYDDYVGAVESLSGIDLDELAGRAATFLEQTADMYSECLRQLVRRRLGIGVDALVRADAAWTFRGDRFDAAFPPERLVDTAVYQMGEMGLDAGHSGRVHFDTEEREGKQPRAFCVPVRVPDEVYLVLRPSGGHSDYRTFWHELGHAMHFASPSKDLPFTARWLGDTSVTEAFAMLWDHLTLNPEWLVRYTEITSADARDLAFELGVNEMYLIRRYAAKLNYELTLHRSGLENMATEYATQLSDATRFRCPDDDYLLDVDPGFYAARYLRAWQLEATLASLLTQRFDSDWYRNPRAGAFVQELMSQGQALAADELVARVADTTLTFEPIWQRLEPVLA